MHVLDRAALVLDETRAFSHIAAQHTALIGGSERPAKQPVAHEPLDPFAVEHVALASRDLLSGSGVDKMDLETGPIEHFIDRNPVHPRRLHGDDRDVMFLEPLCH